ncbi:MAG: aspartyl/asparaginyl beta-hydroxylase domain-containing protein [Planctomycetota bacterium]
MLQQVLAELVAVQFLIAYVYMACVCYVHFRGKVRLRFARQITEHSGLFSPFNVPMYLFSAVPTTPLLPVATFPELAVLRENWQTMRDEALALFDQGRIEYGEKQNDLTFVAFKKRGWKRFHMKWYDDFLPSAVVLCPKTVALVRSIPSINAAAFTMLPPGTKLGKHRDPFATSLRYHLGLVTPKAPGCRIWVDGQEHTWHDGLDLVFDETYIHWAENATAENRIILFCDVTRPLRTPVMRGISNFLNRYVWKITSSHNLEDERPGLLNRFTPAVFKIKYLLIDLKKAHLWVYNSLKVVLLGSLIYLLFLRGMFRT